MTLPPEQIGDKGQRYEIRCQEEDGEVFVIGWSEDPDAFTEAVSLHPSWHFREVIDRHATINELCKDCGACCREMCSPPFEPFEVAVDFPLDAERSLNMGYIVRARDAMADLGDTPCFWLTDDLTCEHYACRPEACRDLEPGSEDCQAWRDQFNIDVEKLTGGTP